MGDAMSTFEIQPEQADRDMEALREALGDSVRAYRALEYSGPPPAFNHVKSGLLREWLAPVALAASVGLVAVLLLRSDPDAPDPVIGESKPHVAAPLSLRPREQSVALAVPSPGAPPARAHQVTTVRFRPPVRPRRDG
jgi:hypothetical protein